MNYCQVSDVQVEFKNTVFSDTTLVSTATVTQMIVEASAYIDSCVGTRYVVPLTDAVSLSLMSLFARTLVADRVRGVMAVKQATNSDANQNEKGVGFNTAAVQKSLQEIMNGIVPLTGAQLILAGAGFKSNNYDNGVQPRFRKNQKQW